jgi:hemolysin III
MTGKTERIQTFGEEVANSVTHGIGALCVLTATPFLVVESSSRGGALAGLAVGVYCATIVTLYLVSTLYHAMRPCRAKQVFRTLDHSAIFLLIAGTYTPFALGALWGPWGWGLLAGVWSLAGVGIIVQATGRQYARRVSMMLYLVMGWLALIAIGPMIEHIAWAGIVLLAAGGVAYTAGVGFYVLKQVRYAHMVWHIFVLIGSTLHFIAVARYAA